MCSLIICSHSLELEHALCVMCFLTVSWSLKIYLLLLLRARIYLCLDHGLCNWLYWWFTCIYVIRSLMFYWIFSANFFYLYTPVVLTKFWLWVEFIFTSSLGMNYTSWLTTSIKNLCIKYLDCYWWWCWWWQELHLTFFPMNFPCWNSSLPKITLNSNSYQAQHSICSINLRVVQLSI